MLEDQYTILHMLLHMHKDMVMEQLNLDTMVEIDIKDQEDLIALVVIPVMVTDIYENI